MYSPKDLEGEVDHSFFDSDCDGEDGQNQNHCNTDSKQQSLGTNVWLDSGRSSNEHLINKDQRRDDNNSQIKDTSIDPNEIRKEVSDVVEHNGVKEKIASDSESIRQNEDKDGPVRSARGDEVRSDVPLQMRGTQSAADRALPNDERADTIIETCSEKEGGSVLLKAQDEQDGLNVGGKSTSQDPDPGSPCSSVSSLASGQDGDREDDDRPSTRSPSEVSGVSSAEEKELEDCDDLYDDVLDDLDVNANEDGYQRSEESGGSDDERPPEPPPPRHKPQPLHGTPRKSSGKFRNHSPRPSSSSELESSCSSDAEGYSSSSTSSSELSSPRRSLAALAMASPRRRPRRGSAPVKERARGPERPSLESEDTVTDVTPLSTPDMSPAQSFDLPVFTVKAEKPEATVTTATAAAQEETEKPKHHEITINLNVTPDSDSKPQASDEEDLFAIETQEPSSLNPSVNVEDTMDKPRSSDQEESSHVSSAHERSLLSLGSLQSDQPGGRQRRNFSFRNDEVWRIDRENQRLLRELSRPCPRSRSASTSAGSTHTATSCTSSRRASGPPPPPRLYHSAINRQREQKRIERENLAFLKRLESVKPSKGITRAEQLADYQRQARYMCTPLPTSAIEGYNSRLEASLTSSQANSSKPYSASARLGPRPGSRSSPAPTKPSHGTTPRPAWS